MYVSLEQVVNNVESNAVLVDADGFSERSIPQGVHYEQWILIQNQIHVGVFARFAQDVQSRELLRKNQELTQHVGVLWTVAVSALNDVIQNVKRLAMSRIKCVLHLLTEEPFEEVESSFFWTFAVDLTGFDIFFVYIAHSIFGVEDRSNWVVMSAVQVFAKLFFELDLSD